MAIHRIPGWLSELSRGWSNGDDCGHAHPLPAFFPVRIFQRLMPIWCISFIFQPSPIHKVKNESSKVLVSQSWPTLCDPMGCSPPGSPVCGDSPGKNTGVGCQVFLQGIFPTQGSNPCLPHCRWILYHLSEQETPTWSLSYPKCVVFLLQLSASLKSFALLHSRFQSL